MAVLLFVENDGHEAAIESNAFDGILTLMMELLDEQVQDTEDEDAEGKFSLYYIG